MVQLNGGIVKSFRNFIILFLSLLSSLLLLLFCVFVYIRFIQKIVHFNEFHSHKSQYNRLSTDYFDSPNVLIYLAPENSESEYDNTDLLLSNVERNKFKCTGSCFCDDEEIRRSSSPVSRLLSCFFVATTSIVAIQYAKQKFEQQCLNEIFNNNDFSMCPKHLIRSEVVECEEKTATEEEEEEVIYPHQEEMKSRFFQEYLEKTMIYSCEGHCLPNIYGQERMTLNPYIENYMKNFHEEIEDRHFLIELEDEYYHFAESYQCETLFLETEIWVDPGNQWDDIIGIGKMTAKDYLNVNLEDAREVFMQFHLEPFCLKNSFSDIFDEDDYTCKPYFEYGTCNELDKEKEENRKCKDCEQREDAHHKKRNLCVSQNISDEWKNPSVKCKMLVDKTDLYQKKMKKIVKRREEFLKKKGKFKDESFDEDNEYWEDQWT